LDAIVTYSQIDRQPSADFVFEYIGAFALLKRLRDLLRRNGGRIGMVTAGANVHYAARKVPEFDHIPFPRARDPSALYFQNSMAIRLCAKEFARRLAEWGVEANAVDAGMVRTLLNFSRYTWGQRLWYSLTRLFIRSAAQGASSKPASCRHIG
jgi:NAD(P)-dependent dehydrogenase (short-subunit alcohol dehydrogenase family)